MKLRHNIAYILMLYFQVTSKYLDEKLLRYIKIIKYRLGERYTPSNSYGYNYSLNNLDVFYLLVI